MVGGVPTGTPVGHEFPRHVVLGLTPVAFVGCGGKSSKKLYPTAPPT